MNISLNQTLTPPPPVDVQVGIVLMFFFICLFLLMILAVCLFSGTFCSGCNFLFKALYLKCCLRCCRPCTRTYQGLVKATKDLMREDMTQEDEIL